MNETPELPTLAILPLNNLLLHEWHDPQRTPPLMGRIRASGVFRNPPIVAGVGDGSGRYVVLDGANRCAALRALGCEHVLVQVVGPEDPGLLLRTWNHVLSGIEPDALLARLQAISTLDVVSSLDLEFELPVRGSMSIALLQISDETLYVLGAPSAELEERIKLLNHIVDVYKTRATMDRTAFTEVFQLAPVYPHLSALVVFPKFDLKDLIQLAAAGALLPPGITRTTISPRALQVNLPLDLLTGPSTTAQKNVALGRLIQERLENQRIKYYPGSTYLFDE